MIFYQVKPEHDNKKRGDGGIYIADELYTIKEAHQKLVNFDYVVKVDILQKDTFCSFGARFPTVVDKQRSTVNYHTLTELNQKLEDEYKLVRRRLKSPEEAITYIRGYCQAVQDFNHIDSAQSKIIIEHFIEQISQLNSR